MEAVEKVITANISGINDKSLVDGDNTKNIDTLAQQQQKEVENQSTTGFI